MEEYKDVMLSEPPSRFTAAPAVQSMALDNYKGILLCDRPANAKATTQSGVQPFLPAGKSDERHIGMQPSVESRSRHELSRSMRQSSQISKPSAVTRHKRWLKSFATAVKQMQYDKVEDQLKAEDKSKKLRSEQAELRKIRKEDVTPQPSGQSSQQREAYAYQAEQEYNGGAEEASSLPALTEDALAKKSKTTKSHFNSKKSGGSTKQKPVWAMTEDEALDAELGLDDHNALLDFASNLNYDKFIDDYEIKEALSIMKDRVKELAAEQGIALEDAVRTPRGENDDDDLVSEAPSMASTTTREIRRAEKLRALELTPANAAKHDSDWNNSTKVSNKMRAALNDEAIVLAERILAQSEGMKAVYTKASLAKMLEDVTMGRELRTQYATNRASAAANLTNLPPVAPPTVSQVSAESGPSQAQQPKRVLTQLRQSKDNVQNLPYMYRCPSL